MKKIYSLLIFGLFTLNVLAQNLQFQANLSYNFALANIGGYVDTAGNEYALVGTEEGLDIVDVTVPSNPVIKFSVPGAQSSWREVKTYREYAYVVTEGGGGLTIVDMSQLPDTVFYKYYVGNGNIAGQLNSIHALHCDTATGYLYLYGSNIDNGNTLFLNLADPWNPTYAGSYNFPTGGNDAYVHDGFALNDTLYEAHIYSGFFTVVDVSNKNNPVLLATQNTPTNFTHNTWLSDDHKTIFTTDENGGSFLTAYDVSDPLNITELSRFQTTPGSGSVVHNTHIINDYAVVSWYTDGVVIVDVARPRNPIQIARYDTYPQGSGNGFDGCWGVYPYLNSGTIVASDINNGLFVLTPTYIRACYLEGIVRDSLTSFLLNNVEVEIMTASIIQNTDAFGEYRTGTVNAGMYDIRVSKPGYVTKTITGVQLSNGVLTQLDILLAPLPAFSFSGIVTDSISTNFIAGAKVVLENPDLSFSTITGVNGAFSFPSIPTGNYTMYAGHWGHRSICLDVSVTQNTTQDAALSPGYYDDFNVDQGWGISGSSLNLWERGNPVGTYDNGGMEIGPEFDVTSDCGENCFVTDNGGAPYNSNDVDNGNTLLISPVFDATMYVDPYLNYHRRYLCIDGVGTPNDFMNITLSNGVSTVTVESIDPLDFTNGTWVSKSFNLASLITPTANMQLTIEVSDAMPGNIVEGAFDQFEITGLLTIGVDENRSDMNRFEVYPNPFSENIVISYDLKITGELPSLIIKDILGREIERKVVSDAGGELIMGGNLEPGVYVISMVNGKSISSKKIIRN